MTTPMVTVLMLGTPLLPVLVTTTAVVPSASFEAVAAVLASPVL